MANTTFNPSDKQANIVLTNANLTARMNTSLQNGLVRAIDKQTFGKFYWECTVDAFTNVGSAVGMAWSVLPTTGSIASAGAAFGVVGLARNGQVWAEGASTLSIDGSSTTISFGTVASATVVCVAVDLTTRLVWFRLGAAGNWNNLAGRNPATGVGGVFIGSLGNGVAAYPAINLSALNDQITANFGDTAFTGAVPSGYTSGFTAGASVPTNALASQALAEHWLTTNPAAQITQVVAEHWASVTSDNLQAVVTQVLIEHWASVAVVVPAAGGPIVTMIH